MSASATETPVPLRSRRNDRVSKLLITFVWISTPYISPHGLAKPRSWAAACITPTTASFPRSAA